MFFQPLEVIIGERPAGFQVLFAVAALRAGVTASPGSAMAARGSGALGQLGTGWDSRGAGLAAPGQPVLADGAAARREVEPWKQKGRSQCSRDR